MDEVLQFFIAIFNKNDELLLPPTLVAGIIKFPNKLPENMTIKGEQQTWNENGYSWSSQVIIPVLAEKIQLVTEIRVW